MISRFPASASKVAHLSTAAGRSSIRVGIDTGGTFTDLAGVDEATGQIIYCKRPSTPTRPDHAVLDAFGRSSIEPSTVSFLILGTTLAINALLQRRGARVLYITTAGFEDVLFIQRINRKFHYDLSWKKPDPFVERRDCLGVAERIAKDGTILQPLDDAELERIGTVVASRLDEEKAGRAQAIAVNLLFAYANPFHELRLRSFLEGRFPDVPVSASHQVAPIWREYERGSTVVADAYVKPITGRFVATLEAGLRSQGLRSSWAIMKSNGSNALAGSAKDEPVQLLLSGLAGGIVAGQYFGEQVQAKNVVSLDMGGTSTDVGVVTDGAIGYTTEYSVEFGIPIAAPFIDLTTIGAGGGSVARIDPGGLLRVGPQSAGAEPGPICYDRGGDVPTVTDANLVLGRLNPNYFLGGDIPLNAERARMGISALGKRFGMSTEDAALAIVDLANENMANAIRLLTVERGIDPRDYALVAFGGAGPLHGADLAEAVGISRVIVPPQPGYGSAFGALLADLRVDRVWTQAFRSDSFDLRLIVERFRSLTDSALAQLALEGFRGTPVAHRSVSMRYLGQNYEQTISVPPGPITELTMTELFERFHRQHERFYGYRIEREVIELVHFNVSAIGSVSRAKLAGLADLPLPRPSTHRPVSFRGSGYVSTPVYRRSQLGCRAVIFGPAIIEEEASTVLVPPGLTASETAPGILVLARAIRS